MTSTFRLVFAGFVLASLAACNDSSSGGGSNPGSGGSGGSGGDAPSTGEGQNTGDAANSGSSSSDMGGGNTLWIVNYSSEEICYVALCDCNIETCAEFDTYMDYDAYVEFTDVPDMCLYLYAEDCYYGVYWEDFLDISSDYTWQLSD
jgi:hypothetical protein